MDERMLQRIKCSLEMSGESIGNLSCIPTHSSLTALTYRIETTKQKYFVKIAEPGHEKMILCEYKGLKKLESSRCVRAPVIYCYQEGEDANPPFLLLEWIENQAGGNASGQTKLGEQLAILHDASAAIFKVNQFGNEEDNYIGANKQVNRWMPDWPTFFVECRLLPQIELGVKQKLIQKEFHDQLLRLCQRIPKYLGSAPITPALLHGDLWGGNVLFNHKDEPILIDPAVYFGAPEAELAFTELFGGFNSDFYNAYTSILPIPYGYRDRKNLYNLYHILNHMNLFGVQYSGQAQSICTYYLKKTNL